MSLDDYVLGNEIPIRLSFFFGIFAVMAIWESLAPCRVLTVSKPVRWLNNIAIVLLNTLLLRLLFPAAAVGMASFCSAAGWGLFNHFETAYWVALVLSVIAMDAVIYLQHVMVHAIPALWRLHRVHHADLDYDLTTGARFHPLEIILSMLIKLATVAVLGPPVLAVLIFEVLLNATAMFNHGNVSISGPIDRFLRWFLVTPDMHRVHHSVEDDETNSNFGFNLSWWDRLFGTYRAQPRAGHLGMEIGIHRFRDASQVNRLPGMLLLPFVGQISGYTINRREWSNSEMGETDDR